MGTQPKFYTDFHSSHKGKLKHQFVSNVGKKAILHVVVNKVPIISQGHKQPNQPMNAVSQTVHKNDTSAGDTIPVVSAHVTTDHSLQGTITGIPARFLVDTGAAASILSKQV